MILNTNYTSLKRALTPFVLFILAVSLLTIQSCRKKRTELAIELLKDSKNKVFRDATPEGFTAEFKQVFEEEKAQIPNVDIVRSYYEQNDYEPVFVLDHLFNNDLSVAAGYFDKANQHGLNPEIFHADSIRAIVARFQKKNGIKTLKQAYHDMAEFEILSAGSLLNYSKILQYGAVNPKRMFQRYFMATRAIDTPGMLHVFALTNMKAYLDSIQPAYPQYIALQKALADSTVAPGLSKEETKRILQVNLERLRWRNKPYEKKYVIVNIPDYTLDVIDSGHSVLNMKVCVGQGRNLKNQNTVLKYDDTCKIDRPYPRETPLLNSMIYCVEVNPVWNIPQSIATKEIIVDAAKDRFYLSNKNILVYKNDKLVENPEDIDWSKITKATASDYDFKQKPGDDNALGKIKFLFKNKSSVYLHDTPAKAAFGLSVRAVSHGCVRLGNPEGLALNLFGDGPKYKLISTDMGKDNPEPTTINLKPKVPVYITYTTSWADSSNVIQYRKDVYGLDIVVYDQLKSYLN
jgi:L,D-transpeptidase YcbB